MQTKEYPFYLCYYQHEDLFTISGDATTLSRGFRIRQIARPVQGGKKITAARQTFTAARNPQAK
jgi:hypothetical protein